MSLRAPCSFRDCGTLVELPGHWTLGARAFCTQFHRDIAAADQGLYLQGVDLDHRPSCPGCGGSGVEDNERWGGGLALCSWPHRNGEPVSGDDARAARFLENLFQRCACGEHVMNLDRVEAARIGGVEELDERGRHHGFERCPDSPCRLAPEGWRCTRGVHREGPCAAVPDVESDHMVDAMRYAFQHAGAWRVPVIEKPIVDRWWFWVGVGALLGGLGGIAAGWAYQLFW